MREFDVVLPATLTIRVSAHSAEEAAFYLHEAFKATNSKDPLEGVKFRYAAYGLNPGSWEAQIMTAVVDIPEDEITVEAI